MLHATISSTGCPGIDGTVITLTYNTGGANATKWTGTLSGREVDFYCFGGGLWVIAWNTCQGLASASGSATCSPLSFVKTVTMPASGDCPPCHASDTVTFTITA